ncbi:uncharacterized protein isoform X2 [Rhodnius prolixus]|uniref:uncharacterized protein isoform X2 n=1 Tax=Rhodnius prolixus TaxID=13249 RepID=UPI003D18A5FF
MARFLSVSLCLATMIAVVASQGFDYFGGFPGFAASPRDPRANRGPVTFPVTQPGRETSGVRVGASGYGFVPPGARGGIGPHGAGPNYFSGLQYW